MDFGAVLALAAARGVCAAAAAELLPALEGALVEAANRRIGGDRSG
jgi:hypothetical protein